MQEMVQCTAFWCNRRGVSVTLITAFCDVHHTSLPALRGAGNFHEDLHWLVQWTKVRFVTPGTAPVARRRGRREPTAQAASPQSELGNGRLPSVGGGGRATCRLRLPGSTQICSALRASLSCASGKSMGQLSNPFLGVRRWWALPREAQLAAWSVSFSGTAGR